MAKLKDIVACARDGCISEPGRVAEIVNSFVNSNFAQMCYRANMSCEECFGDVIASVKLQEEVLGKLNYIEMVTLMDNVHYRVDYLKRIFMEATLSVPIQMFLYLSVKAFYDYLESRHYNKLAEAAYKTLVRNAKESFQYEINEKTTIYALLKVLASVRSSDDMVEAVLIGSFQIGFRERCYVEDVINNHLMEEEDFDYGKYFI